MVREKNVPHIIVQVQGIESLSPTQFSRVSIIHGPFRNRTLAESQAAAWHEAEVERYNEGLVSGPLGWYTTLPLHVPADYIQEAVRAVRERKTSLITHVR